MTNKELFDSKSFKELEEFASKEGNFEKLENVISKRAKQAFELGSQLDEVRMNAKAQAQLEKDIRKELNILKDQTARMVEVLTESNYFTPTYEELPDDLVLGNLKEVTSYDPNTREWLEARFDTIGGSDVGTLVVNEFSDDLKYWDKLSLKKLIESKTMPVTEKEVNFQDYSIEAHKGGPLYRGTVWEDFSREIFARENPEYKVYNTKKQYARVDRPFQQVNFDGILSDRNDFKPNGILELKTGTYFSDWRNGIPLNYRAQVLYYLNASGFDYAIIGVLINDNELICYKLYKNDPVVPGKYESNMENYIKERIIPWFEEVKELRV